MQRLRNLGGTFILAILAALTASAAAPPKAQLPQEPNELVRAVIQNELKQTSAEGAMYMWRQKTVKPQRTTTREMVETPDGVIGRVLLINGTPLNDQQRKEEDARVNRLLDPSKMRDKRKEQEEDDRRTRKMVGAMPDAFIYQYAGTEQRNGHTFVTLSFKPNPTFDPPSRETMVFEAMEGTITLDTTAQRIAKIDGTMFRDISIGWGIIGHLDKGGRFIVEQNEVDPGHWEITRMRLLFTGKALMFKTIKIDQVDEASNFRRVQKMTVAQALDLLKKSEATVAQSNAQSASAQP